MSDVLFGQLKLIYGHLPPVG